MKNERIEFLEMLEKICQQEGFTQQKITEKTGYIRSNISRIFSGKFSPSIDIILNIAKAIGYKLTLSKHHKGYGPVNGVTPKFLFCPDPINNELYILHVNYPSCLIHVNKELPARFIIVCLYDYVENEADILTMPFVQEAKDFFKHQVKDNLLDN